MKPNDLDQLLGPSPSMPAFSILKLAVLAGQDGAGLDVDTVLLMASQVEGGAFDCLAPDQIWPEIARGLMGPVPSRMLRVLRNCGALRVLLPEVADVFGVPQSADDPPQVDIGDHVLRILDQAAGRGAPLAVRFAALVMNVGKADSPPEHLPAHYRHMERARPRIEAICARFAVPAECREMALLGLAEVERVHRAARMRAGSMAAMLERIDAFGQEDRFEELLMLCACDFHAYPGREDRPYPKAEMLRVSLAACRAIDADGIDEAAEDADAALLEARALAIAAALRSSRWADSDDAPVPG
jgi:tRNA nucleotidyltransferase (CCA-adding enzyme)